MVHSRCSPATLLLLSCCNPPAALLLLPSCCCPAETHLTPPAGGGVTGHLMCQLASVEATFPKCGGVCQTPGREGALYWDSGRTTPKCGGNMRMLREPHIKPHPVVGKCATRTFSSNPSVVKLRSEESSLKRPMLREPHIKGGPARVLARVYISLLCARTVPCATGAHYACPRH